MIRRQSNIFNSIGIRLLDIVLVAHFKDFFVEKDERKPETKHEDLFYLRIWVVNLEILQSEAPS